MAPKVWAQEARGLSAANEAVSTVIVLAAGAGVAWLAAARFGGIGAAVLAVVTGTTWSLLPRVASWAARHDVTAPTGGRSVHAARTPLAGGLAMALPALAVLAVVGDAAHAALAAAGLLMVVSGAWDDFLGLPPARKLALQAVAALVLYAGGFRLSGVGLPPFGALATSYFELPLTVFWVLLVVNAFNLSDGIDGLAAGLGLFACVACMALGAGGVGPVLLAGGLLGVLRFNLPTATAFLGDAGSQLVGLMVAAFALQTPGGNAALAIALVAVPLGDVALTIVRRPLLGKSLFTADRGHMHHLLLAILGRPVAVLAVMLSVAAAQMTAALLLPNLAGLGIVALLWAALCCFVAWRARDRIRERFEQRRAFRRLNLLRAYAEGSLRLAEARHDVQPILARVAEDLGIPNLRLRDIEVQGRNGVPVVVETIECGRAEARVHYPVRDRDPLEEERRTLLCDVLRVAESVLTELEGEPAAV